MSAFSFGSHEVGRRQSGMYFEPGKSEGFHQTDHILGPHVTRQERGMNFDAQQLARLLG